MKAANDLELVVYFLRACAKVSSDIPCMGEAACDSRLVGGFLWELEAC